MATVLNHFAKSWFLLTSWKQATCDLLTMPSSCLTFFSQLLQFHFSPTLMIPTIPYISVFSAGSSPTLSVLEVLVPFFLPSLPWRFVPSPGFQYHLCADVLQPRLLPWTLVSCPMSTDTSTWIANKNLELTSMPQMGLLTSPRLTPAASMMIDHFSFQLKTLY